MAKKLPKPLDPQKNAEEYERFLETAREVGAKEDPKAFDRAFKKVTKLKSHRPN